MILCADIFALIFMNEISLEFSLMHNNDEVLHLFSKGYLYFLCEGGFSK